MKVSPTMDAKAYKRLHEAFMQNHYGCSPLHTFLYIFLTVQCVLYTSLKPQRSGLAQYVQEFLIIVTLILSHTVLSNFIVFLNVTVSILLLFSILKHRSPWQFIKVLSQKNVFKSRIMSVTMFRGMTYITTVFCILAVDFRAFPRFLAKTERFGISVMDQGVGLFVIMSGLVHKDLRTNSLRQIFKSNAKFIFVLVGLGLARVVAVKQLDYQEHVTEYGVHWNFFFTLAVCKIISTIVLYYCNRPLLMSILTLISHEILLDLGMRNWVFGRSLRLNIIDANREGITSSLGYVSLYLFAVYVRKVLNDSTLTRYQVLLRFLGTSLLLYFILSLNNIFGHACRVLVSSVYCFFLVMIFLIALSTMYLVEVLFQDPDTESIMKVPLIVSAASHHGLFYFLLANILTGAVNLSMRTFFISTHVAVIILHLYMLVTTGGVVLLDKKCRCHILGDTMTSV